MKFGSRRTANDADTREVHISRALTKNDETQFLAKCIEIFLRLGNLSQNRVYFLVAGLLSFVICHKLM